MELRHLQRIWRKKSQGRIKAEFSWGSALGKIPEYYDLTVRRVEEGLVSNFLLDEVQRGDLLQSSGPEGHFYFNPLFHDKTMVCLAGGSGITPFMSIIREVVECGLDREMVLFYGNPDLREAIFHHLLLDLSERFSHFHYIPVIETPPEGY